MAALEAATLPIFSLYPSSFTKSPSPPLVACSTKPLHISNSTLLLSHKLPLSPLTNSLTRKLCFQLCSTVQEEVTVEAESEQEPEPDQTQTQNIKRKLYVFNLPWTLSVAEIKEIFGQCGAVTDVEIIKQKEGRNRNFAFVTMASGEEAQAVIDKFDAQEVSGRIIRIDFAKSFKRPSPPRPPSPPAGETENKLYVSNLAWKVRSSHLREFFSADFKLTSAKVVFENPSGRSAGYGFVSFATKEEAEAAISSLDGKELMGRPIRLKISQRNVDVSGSEKEEVETSEDQPAES